MKRIAIACLFAALGLVLPLLVVIAVEKLGLTPRFPVFAGEDDFSVRIRYFLLCVLPAFLLTGAWIGAIYGNDRTSAARMLTGVIGGTLLAFASVRALSDRIGGISSRDAANDAVLVFFFSWIALAVLGAWIGYRWRPLRRGEQRQ